MKHNWFKVKAELAANGINISKPLFHASKIQHFNSIITEGLKSKNQTLCFSRSLDLYTPGNASLNLSWADPDFILIFNEQDIRYRLKLDPYNYFFSICVNKGDFEFGLNKGSHEFEERISGNISIPAKYIKAIISNDFLDTDIPVIRFNKNKYYMLNNGTDLSKYQKIDPTKPNEYLRVKKLIEKGLNVKDKYLAEVTSAVKNKQISLAYLLLKHGAAYDEKTLYAALDTDTSLILNFCLENGGFKNLEYALYHTVNTKHIENILSYMKSISDLGMRKVFEHKDFDLSLHMINKFNIKNIPMSLLIRCGDTKLIKYCIDNKIAKGVIKDSSLEYAILKNPDMLEYLLTNFDITLDINSIYLALAENKYEAAKLLLNHNIDLDQNIFEIVLAKGDNWVQLFVPYLQPKYVPEYLTLDKVKTLLKYNQRPDILKKIKEYSDKEILLYLEHMRKSGLYV